MEDNGPKVYFGFATADSMFPPECAVTRVPVDVADIKDMESILIPVINASHMATIKAMRERFNINVDIPEKPPQVNLKRGDIMIVMSVRGLPRLTESRHYTEDEVSTATFAFGKWTVTL